MSAETSAGARRRLRARVQGTVQGVGFRPFVYRLAQTHALVGYVLNDAHGVLLEVEGPDAELQQFLAALECEAPPLAVLERVSVDELTVTGERDFQIRASPYGELADAPVTSDSATCADCLHELSDPTDHRYRYPFTNCTNCGPRFTIVRGIPYDRPYTTMAAFKMCPRCQAEYDDPADRRFHAQPNACPACGPAVSLLDVSGGPVSLGAARDAVEAAARALLEGRILAVKGIGGYHLACRANDEQTVARLRAHKRREDKPFALMASDLAAAEELVTLGEAERELLCSAPRPIVLALRRVAAPVASSVAPGAPELGVMLPYSPLHHVLLADVGSALVMTSGNVSDEPIAYRDGDARERLAGIAELFLVHDREIETRTDDSVTRVVALDGTRRRVFLRRSRGYVPASIALPAGGTERALLACGAELKNTFCVAKGERAWVSHHIGDLENYETLESFTEGIEHFCTLFDVAPDLVVHDLHPEYLSTKYALERSGVELVGVQHHHAHLAACLAEHGFDGQAVGAIFDGSGFGGDGTIWGGELLHGDARSFERVGALRTVPLPGGAQAIRQPWRMACAWLDAAGLAGPEPPAALAASVTAASWSAVLRLAREGVASPLTSSIGRLFDAASALCDIRASINYEGQAAIELEAAADPHEAGTYPVELDEAEGLLTIDPRPALEALLADVERGTATGVVAARFHNAIADATVSACAKLAEACSTEAIVLSGGVFANRRLLETTARGLAKRGLRVLVPLSLPTGDGGISYGQAAIAAAQLRS